MTRHDDEAPAPATRDYEDYEQKAVLYDRTRRAIGLEIILGCLARTAGPLGRLRILDAACGTGNYTAELAPIVEWITGVDISPRSLAMAHTKLVEATPGRAAQLELARVEALPFREESFDAALAVQLLHHLGDDAASGWSVHRQALGELARVVRPGGVLVIGTSSRAQLRDGYWYYALISRAADELATRYAPIETVIELMDAAGFSFAGQFVPIHETLQGDSYFDSRAPLSPEWRAGESTWALITDDELHWAETTLRTLDEADELDHFVGAKDQRRSEVGQVTFLCGIRA